MGRSHVLFLRYLAASFGRFRIFFARIDIEFNQFIIKVKFGLFLLLLALDLICLVLIVNNFVAARRTALVSA